MKPINLTKEIENNKETQEVVLPIMYSYKEKRDKVLSEEEKKTFREELRKIKEDSINNIIELGVMGSPALVINGRVANVGMPENEEKLLSIIKKSFK